MSAQTDRLVIAGGGVAGLALALAAGRQGIDVLVLERDAAPTADSPEAAFLAERSGAPQVHQTHGFLARLTRVLRERFPDIFEALVEAGAHTLPLTRELGEPRPGDEELAILVARRTTFEWVLRRAMAGEAQVELRTGVAVDGVVADRDLDGIPRVGGARTSDGQVLAGRVAACTGRRGDVPAWLGPLGVEVPETVHDSRLVYLTRWYRFADGDGPELEPRLGGDLGFVKYLAVPCDGGTFSVTLAVPSHDGELRAALLDPERFELACRALPGPDQFFRHGPLEALGGVRPMGGLGNRLRRFLAEDGRPRVAGFHAVGDAHTYTNPLYGRGCALAFVQATLLADAMSAHPDDLLAQATTYEAGCARDIEPWFHGAVQMDQYRPPSRQGDANGNGSDDGAEDPAPPSPEQAAGDVIARVATEGRTDPVIGRGMIRLFNLLTLPHELLADGEFMARVAPIVTQPPSPPPPPEGPTREELFDAL